ncbi:hypothetical protein [Oerskovia turbata]
MTAQTVTDHLYVLDDSGQATQIRRPAATERVRSLLATLPPGLADQIERAAAEYAAAAPEGEVLYAACWCDNSAHSRIDRWDWHESVERAQRDMTSTPYPVPHLIRRITVTEAVA